MSLYQLRKIEKEDFHKNYLCLLKQLTTIDPDKINKEMFDTFLDKLNENHQIYVIEQTEQHIIIGTITIIFEQKLIHTMGIVCSIEDVIIDTNFRGLKLSKLLINKAVELSKYYGCYKIILNCNDDNVVIYEKNGFKNNGNLMSLYF
jgi:glucosamine-phosphate N-acetyltransferase